MPPSFPFLHLVTIVTCCLAGGIKYSNYENGPSYRNQKALRSTYGGPSFGPSYGYTSIGSRTIQLSCVPDQMLIGFYLCEAINPTAAQLQLYPTYKYAQNMHGQSLGNYGTIPNQFKYQQRRPNPFGMSSNYIRPEILPPGGGSPITINCNSPTGDANNNPTGGANNNPTGDANNQSGCNCDQTAGISSPQQPTGGSNSVSDPIGQTLGALGKSPDTSKSAPGSTLQNQGTDSGIDGDNMADAHGERRRRIKIRGKLVNLLKTD